MISEKKLSRYEAAIADHLDGTKDIQLSHAITTCVVLIKEIRALQKVAEAAKRLHDETDWVNAPNLTGELATALKQAGYMDNKTGRLSS